MFKLGFIGMGNMAGAIAAGILLTGLFAGILVACKSKIETTSGDVKNQSEENTKSSQRITSGCQGSQFSKKIWF